MSKKNSTSKRSLAALGMTSKWIPYVLNLSLVLAFSVVMLGAYTRLTNAGLGCPDWPFCYGHMLAPSTSQKAWTEMIHRYFAGTLGLFIVIISLGLVCKRLKAPLALTLLAMLVAQAALGMWTVTLKLLPVVVMAHLLGGILIFSLLAALRVELGSFSAPLPSGFRFWIGLALTLLLVQIALGGWVSANYAGLACVGFPTCNGQWMSSWHFGQGFHLFAPVGTNYQGGVLDIADRVTIQMVHRLGAMIAGCTIIALSVALLLKGIKGLLARLCGLAIVLVLVQWGLGILNVIYMLPIVVAVAHNGVAALLMATMTVIWVSTRRKTWV